jgi:hypothetical protein
MDNPDVLVRAAAISAMGNRYDEVQRAIIPAVLSAATRLSDGAVWVIRCEAVVGKARPAVV